MTLSPEATDHREAALNPFKYAIKEWALEHVEVVAPPIGSTAKPTDVRTGTTKKTEERDRIRDTCDRVHAGPIHLRAGPRTWLSGRPH